MGVLGDVRGQLLDQRLPTDSRRRTALRAPRTPVPATAASRARAAANVSCGPWARSRGRRVVRARRDTLARRRRGRSGFAQRGPSAADRGVAATCPAPAASSAGPARLCARDRPLGRAGAREERRAHREHQGNQRQGRQPEQTLVQMLHLPPVEAPPTGSVISRWSRSRTVSRLSLSFPAVHFFITLLSGESRLKENSAPSSAKRAGTAWGSRAPPVWELRARSRCDRRRRRRSRR